MYKKLYDQDQSLYFSKICEELAELQVAILHYRDGKAEYSQVVEELADVIIQYDKIVAFISGFGKVEEDLTIANILKIREEKLTNIY